MSTAEGKAEPVNVRILDREYTVGVSAEERESLVAASRVLDEVSTSELKVDIEAESTSTITRPTSKSGKVESMVGMMES